MRLGGGRYGPSPCGEASLLGLWLGYVSDQWEEHRGW